MRTHLIAMLVSASAFCCECAISETVAEIFTNNIHFTHIADSNEIEASSISGVYREGNPDVGGLSGKTLWLFPSGTFYLSEWSDIVPETAILSGSWQLNNLTLTLHTVKDVPGLDTLYTPVIYDDGRKCRILLVGHSWGKKQFQDKLIEYSNWLGKARAEYASISDRTDDFVYRSWAEEFTYTMMFSAGFTMSTPIATEEEMKIKEQIIQKQNGLPKQEKR